MSGSARTQFAIAAAGLSASAWLLARFPPHLFALYPVCPFHEWLGIQCPGCGFTHALADLIQGRVQAAVSENAMVFLLVPAAMLFGIIQSYSVLRWDRWQPIRFSQQWIFGLSTAMLIFGVVRNLA